MKTEIQSVCKASGAKRNLNWLYHYLGIGWLALYSLGPRYRYSSREGDIDEYAPPNVSLCVRQPSYSTISTLFSHLEDV